MDVENDPEGRKQLHQLGLRRVPVVAKGWQFILAKDLEAVAEFVGVQGTGHIPLPPEELFKKWIKVLRAAQRYVRQIPDEQMNLNATHNRGRPIRLLGHHLFSIGEAHLECAVNNVKYLSGLTTQSLEDGTFTTSEEIARYGDEVIARLEQWWSGLVDKLCQQRIAITDYGVISMHQLLNRSTWHAAHHVRQLADVLERLGIEPDGRLAKEDLAGLPLPKRIWD